MTMFIDASSLQGGGTNTGSTYNHATGTEDDPYLVGVIWFGDSAANDTAMTVGGNAMDLISKEPSTLDVFGIAVYGLEGVTGTQSVVSSYSSAEAWTATALLSGVDQTSPIRDIATAYRVGVDQIIDATVDTQPGDMVLSFATCDSDTMTPAETSVIADNNSDFKGMSRTTASGSTTTMTWSKSSEVFNESRIVVVSFRPAAAAITEAYIRERLVDKDGDPVASETGITMIVYHTVPTEASPNPYEVIEDVATDSSGDIDVEISLGDLEDGDPVWIALVKDGTPPQGTFKKVVPVYE